MLQPSSDASLADAGAGVDVIVRSVLVAIADAASGD